MFRQSISALVLSAITLTPALAAPRTQTGIIHFKGYVYDDTAIRDQAKLLQEYVALQNTNTTVNLTQLSQSDRLVVQQYEQHGKTIIEVSFI